MSNSLQTVLDDGRAGQSSYRRHKVVKARVDLENFDGYCLSIPGSSLNRLPGWFPQVVPEAMGECSFPLSWSRAVNLSLLDNSH